MSVTSTIEVKRTKRGYRYYKLRKAFSKFYRKHSAFIDKYNVGLIVLLQHGILKQVFNPLPHDNAY